VFIKFKPDVKGLVPLFRHCYIILEIKNFIDLACQECIDPQNLVSVQYQNFYPEKIPYHKNLKF